MTTIKINKLLFIYVFLTLCLNSITFAGDKECTEFHKPSGAFHVYRFPSQDGHCFLSADPQNMPDLVYRSYLLTDEGILMVFNSIDKEAYGVSDGARVFHFFPRTQMPSLSYDENSNVILQTSNPEISLILSRQEAKIVGMSGGQVIEDPKVNPNNNGGVEFKNVKGLYLDSGYTSLADPTANPSRNSTFVDSKQNKCTVKNKDLFSYDSDGDPNFKFTDAQLKTWLAKNCPKLNLNF